MKTLAPALGACVALMLGLGAAPALAKPDAPAFNKLAADLWEIHDLNDAANVTVLVTDEGLVVVDGRFDKQYDDLMKMIREKISTNPIKYLINTHYHGDHAGANDRYQQAGATVIGSIGTHDRLAAQAKATATVAAPTIAFSGELRLYVGGKEVLLTSLGPAHTDTDITVLFVQDRVICTGDLGYSPDDPMAVDGQHPLIDYRGGGSVEGWIARLDTITASTDYDVVVPGHSFLAKKADLIVYRDVLESLRDHVRAYLRDGTKTEADLKAYLISDLKWPSKGMAIDNAHGLYVEFKP